MIQLTIRDLKALNRGLYLKNVHSLLEATYMGSLSDVNALRSMVEDPEVITMVMTKLNAEKRKNAMLLNQRDWDVAEILHGVRKITESPKVTAFDVCVVLTTVAGLGAVCVAAGMFIASLF